MWPEFAGFHRKWWLFVENDPNYKKKRDPSTMVSAHSIAFPAETDM